MNKAEAYAYRAKIERAAAQQSDELALDSIELFPAWKPDINVLVDERYRYNDKLYRVLISHTTQDSWRPDVSPSIFVEVSIEEWPEIVIPIPSTNPYMAGDKVTYNGLHYICQIDYCTWTPDEYPSAWEFVA